MSNEPVRGPYRRSALVFGERNKLTAEGPFLDLLAQFRLELEPAHRLVVVGYSFRDAHINEMIRRWVNGDRNRHVVVIDPNFPSNGFQQELMRLLAPPSARPAPGSAADHSHPRFGGGRIGRVDRCRWVTTSHGLGCLRPWMPPGSQPSDGYRPT